MHMKIDPLAQSAADYRVTVCAFTSTQRRASSGESPGPLT